MAQWALIHLIWPVKHWGWKLPIELLKKPVFAKGCSGYSSRYTGGDSSYGWCHSRLWDKTAPRFWKRKHEKIEMKKAFPLRANVIRNGQIMNLISKRSKKEDLSIFMAMSVTENLETNTQIQPDSSKYHWLCSQSLFPTAKSCLCLILIASPLQLCWLALDSPFI